VSGMVPELGGYLASWLTKTGVVADEVFDMGESTERFMDQQQLVIGFIRTYSSSPARSFGGLIEFNRADIQNPDQEKIEKFFQNTLNTLIENCGFWQSFFAVSTFYIDPTRSSGYPHFAALRLEGVDISDKTIIYFKAALSLLCSELLGQASLLEAQDPADTLSQNDEKFLKDAARQFCCRNSNKEIQKAFYVQIGFEDDQGVLFDGNYAPGNNEKAVNETVEGITKPDGFSISDNKLYLYLKKDGQPNSKKTIVNCQHQDHFELTANACLLRANLRYVVRREKKPSSKKEVWSLVSLELMADNDEGVFELT